MVTRSIVFSFALLLASCTATSYRDDIAKTERLFYDNSLPYHASRTLIEKVNKNSPDSLLYLMEAGSLLHTAGDFETSNQLLAKASAIAAKSVTSISGETVSLLTNEKGQNYKPIVYEHIGVNLVSGLNYLALNIAESALVEFRKVNYLLEKENQKGNKALSENLFARLMAAYAAIAQKDFEYAYIELKKIHAVQPGLQPTGMLLYYTAHQLRENQEAEQWKKMYGLPAVSANAVPLVFVHEAGKIPVRKSRGRLLEEPGTQALLEAALRVAIYTQSAEGVTVSAAMAALATVEHPIPTYEHRDYRATSAEIDLSGAKRLQGRTVQITNMGNLFTGNIEKQYPEMKEKMILRIATKLVASLVARFAAEKIAKESGASGGTALLTGIVAGVAVGITTMASESPDLRCWHTLPDFYGVAVLMAEPGEYTGTIRYIEGPKGLLWERSLERVVIQPGIPLIYLTRTSY